MARIAFFPLLTVVALALGLSSVEAAPPPNDEFPGTLINSLPFSDSLNTGQATVRPEDPECGPTRNMVWYSYTPSADTVLVADTGGSDFLAGVGVFLGDSLTSLSCVTAATPLMGGLPLMFPAFAGHTYHFQVGGGGPSGVPPPAPSGNLVFTLSEVAGPPNDNFPGKEITGLPFTHSVDTTFATIEPGEFALFGATVWYNFKANVDAIITLDLSESDYSPLVWIKKGLDDGVGFSNRCAGSTENLIISSVVAGETYYFQIGGNGFPGETGTLVVTLYLTPGQTCPPPASPAVTPTLGEVGFPKGGGPPPGHGAPGQAPWLYTAAASAALAVLGIIASRARRQHR